MQIILFWRGRTIDCVRSAYSTMYALKQTDAKKWKPEALLRWLTTYNNAYEVQGCLLSFLSCILYSFYFTVTLHITAPSSSRCYLSNPGISRAQNRTVVLIRNLPASHLNFLVAYRYVRTGSLLSQQGVWRSDEIEIGSFEVKLEWRAARGAELLLLLSRRSLSETFTGHDK